MLRRIPVLVWFLVPTFILVGFGVWFLSKNQTVSQNQVLGEAATVSNPVEGTVDFAIVGRDHIASGTAGSGYDSNPPSSGPHWPAAANNGVYDKELPDEQLIHNLEHGHVWISYKPDTADEVKNKLKEIVEKDSWKVVLEPREQNDSKIALVAWGRVLVMDQPDYDKIEAFIKTYRNRGPESTSD